MTSRDGGGRVARVLPDVPAIDKEFDYLVPAGTAVSVGDVVRIVLHGRRVGGWVVALDVEPVAGVKLRELSKVSGRGPAPALIDLAGWAARRWAGRRASFLRTAAPPAVVSGVLQRPSSASGPRPALAGVHRPSDAMRRALVADGAVLRLGPGADRYPAIALVVDQVRAVDGGQALVLCPSVGEARVLGRRLRRDGVRVAIVANDVTGAEAAGEWRFAASGTAEVVVGARSAAWAPAPGLARVVVLDEHDEAYQQEQAPTWNARDVVVERARRAGVRWLAISPCPSLEVLDEGTLVVEDRAVERRSWPRVEVVDQRDLDPTLGPLFSPRLVDLLRGPGRVVCVVNRTGRARLLACRACATLARCEVCDAAVHQVDASDDDGQPIDLDRFGCQRCGASRPMICLACGSSGFKHLRLGVSRVREEMEALAGEPVLEVTGASDDAAASLDDHRILVGTEAVLHRVPRATAVAFLDFDQELLSLRYRAAEQAMGLLARAGRIVQRGGDGRGTVLIQTRTPDHPAVQAAHLGDPGAMVDDERALRRALALPPTTAMALVSGASAEEFVRLLGRPDDARIQGPVDGAWRIVAPDHERLAEVLAAVPRPPGRLRLEVDPLRA